MRQRRPGGVAQRPSVVHKVCSCSGRHQHCDHHDPGRRHSHHPSSFPDSSDCDCPRGPGLVLLQSQKCRRAAAAAPAVRHYRQPRRAVNGAISIQIYSLNGRARAENLHRMCLPGKHRQTGRRLQRRYAHVRLWVNIGRVSRDPCLLKSGCRRGRYLPVSHPAGWLHLLDDTRAVPGRFVDRSVGGRARCSDCGLDSMSYCSNIQVDRPCSARDRAGL